MKNTFTEDTRVKIPALIHLTRLGYTYISQKEHYKRNEETNIFPDIFKESLRRINSDNISDDDLDRLLNDITFELDNQDLGEAFYKRLSSGSGIRLIDFENFNNNSFHVTTELSCVNGADEFRPDITVFINGMPLSFIEVKKPNNKDGILAERTRINKRYANRKFRRFANITQLMIFSNNSEYQDGVIEPIQGAYYATSSYKNLKFNYFREDPDYPVKERLQSLDEKTELFILKDSNQIVIKDNVEFNTNKHYDTPTNRILTSMLSRERLAFILRYALVYVHEKSELGEPIVQKHIMRYPQLFATIAIGAKLDQGITKGIIWHTQGSGKTALAYYNVKYLTDYYQKQNVIPKFFIVDRLDLLKQASTEFSNRGLKVNEVNSRQDFIRNIKRVAGLQNSLGIPEITVVNIQKFSEESSVVELTDYDINTQCIYFLDEAHRSYNPKGDYLAKLLKSDKNAIKIALTGTPLLKEVAKEYDSKKLFGDYIHKYYYNMSIADGYTLRLIREQIENKFKMEMQHVLESIRVKQGEFSKAELYAKPKFVKPLLKYITNDLIRFKRDSGDYSLGGMVICDSAEQAKELFKQFELEYGDQEIVASRLVAEERDNYNSSPKLRAALILHDENDTEIRTELIEAFKASKIDILFVYNMLLTGFSANNLKKLYVNRVIKDHNLLQALTRVNRPFKDFRYGYVVDFADISNAFDRTNRLYYEELQDQLGDDFEYYNHIFKSREEIDNELLDIKEVLFHYDIVNKENFCRQIQQINDKNVLVEIIKVLQLGKELKNIIILEGYDDLEEKLNFADYNRLLILAKSQLEKLNLIDNIDNKEESNHLLDLALEDIYFEFVKIGENELKLADELKNQLQRTREALVNNFDHQDPQFISLKEELERIFKKKNLNEVNQRDMTEHIHLLDIIYKEVQELNRKNNLLKNKYQEDEKYVRIHKRLLEDKVMNSKEIQLYEALLKVKDLTDSQLEKNKDRINQEDYFEAGIRTAIAKEFVVNQQINLDASARMKITNLIATEYFNQYQGRRF